MKTRRQPHRGHFMRAPKSLIGNPRPRVQINIARSASICETHGLYFSFRRHPLSISATLGKPTT